MPSVRPYPSAKAAEDQKIRSTPNKHNPAEQVNSYRAPNLERRKAIESKVNEIQKQMATGGYSAQTALKKMGYTR